jgi:hypothetical protein
VSREIGEDVNICSAIAVLQRLLRMNLGGTDQVQQRQLLVKFLVSIYKITLNPAL